MGEIGGDDYNHALLNGIKLDEVKSYVPAVVREIASAVEVKNNLKFVDHWSNSLLLLDNYITCISKKRNYSSDVILKFIR